MTTEIKTEPMCSIEDSDFSSGILPAVPKRVRLPEDLSVLDNRDSIINLWNEQELYIDQLECALRDNEIKSVFLILIIKQNVNAVHFMAVFNFLCRFLIKKKWILAH